MDASRQAWLERQLAEYATAERTQVSPRPPFAGEQLSRMDVEWLIANATAPGTAPAPLDLREADLRDVDLSGLTLSSARLAAANLAGASLRGTHLEGAKLYKANLAGAKMDGAFLTGANLSSADLREAHASRAFCEGAHFDYAHLEGADFKIAHLECADMRQAHLEGTGLRTRWLSGVDLRKAHLEGADLGGAQLAARTLNKEEYARIAKWAPDFPQRIPAGDLREAFFDSATILKDSIFAADGDAVRVVDTHWNEVNLATITWGSQFARHGACLGDELVARRGGRSRDEAEDAKAYSAAVRANRQLAVTLRGQGLNEEADIFAYRAQLCQRDLVTRQARKGDLAHVGALLFSWFLWLVTGYGYRMKRIVITYAVVVLAFAATYYVLHGWPLPFVLGGRAGGAATLAVVWKDVVGAVVLSVTAFHGRVFAGGIAPDSPLGVVAAVEAIFGLVIEGVFIAMLTQRFFSR